MSLIPTVLVRSALLDEEEWQALNAAAVRHGVRVTETVVGATNALVLSRLATAPHYREVSRDLALQGSRLIHSPAQYEWIATMGYLDPLAGMTPPAWFSLQEIPRDSGPWVVKGASTSRKLRWNEEMYAPTWDDMLRIRTLLERDSYIGEQQIAVRPFVPLRVLETGLFGLPFSNEHRCVFWGGELLGHGFYWTDMTEVTGTLAPEGLALARQAAKLMLPTVRVPVIDVAEQADGRWMVVEVNDLHQSGLSGLDLPAVYDQICGALARDAAEADEGKTTEDTTFVVRPKTGSRGVAPLMGGPSHVGTGNVVVGNIAPESVGSDGDGGPMTGNHIDVPPIRGRQHVEAEQSVSAELKRFGVERCC